MKRPDPLIEAVTTAHRGRDPDGRIRPHAAWADLDAAGRAQAFEEVVRQRALERALDAEGLSGTAHAVLRRIADAS
jgi:hypothetical protein